MSAGERRVWRSYAWGTATVVACTAIAGLMFPYFALANLIMVYLVGVVVVASRWGRGPSILSAVLSVALFDYLYVPPYFTFAVSDTEYVVTFAVMLMMGLLISGLTVRIKEQAEEKLRNAILAAVSHDLRTPLAAISGAASSLASSGDRLDPEARRELVLTIHEEAQRMNRLANNLLEMGRLQSRTVALHREWQPIEEVFGSALHQLESSIQGREVAIRVPDDLPLVAIDEVLIERVLVNLIENALRYTPAGTPIELIASARPGEMTVEVLDRGTGIAPGERIVIFDKFFRGEAARSRHGVGLGLSVARAIVEAHGGRIGAENRPDGGAAFRFTLPIEGEPPSLAPAARGPGGGT